MKRFVVPPNWPTPPRRSWMPPKTWQPDPAWPPAPAGWKFWVNGKGTPVTGPIGRYGAPSTRAVVAGASAVVLFLSANVWGLNAMGLFDGDDKPAPRAAPLSTETPSPSVTPAAPKTSSRPSPQPSAEQTKTRASKQPNRSQQRRPARSTSPTPTASTSRPPTSRPTSRPTTVPTTRPTARPTTGPTGPTTGPMSPQPSTREEIFAEYCRRQGYPPQWCDPSNWPSQEPRGRRRG